MARHVATLSALLAAVACASCDSPTLPLPPPSLPTVTADTAGHYKLRADHGVEPDAIVVIFNHDPNVSLSDRASAAQADHEGTWEQTIVAFPGDVVDVSQEFGTTSSPQTTFQIPK